MIDAYVLWLQLNLEPKPTKRVIKASWLAFFISLYTYRVFKIINLIKKKFLSLFKKNLMKIRLEMIQDCYLDRGATYTRAKKM